MAALEHGERRLAPEHRLDRRGQPGQVVLDQLVLQGEGGRGDDHRTLHEQGGGEVSQALAGARAGLHEQVLTVLDRLVDRLDHGLLTWAGTAPGDSADRGGEELLGGRLLFGSCGHAGTVPGTTDISGSPLGCTHAERDGPGHLHEVRRFGASRLSGPSARRGRPGHLGRRDARDGLGLPRPAVRRADPVRAARPASRVVDRHVQPTPADQRGLLRHHHPGALGG